MKAFNFENYLGEKKRNYFEGWYFRHGGEMPFSFIAGVTKSRDAHGFVQYIDENTSHYFRFPLSEFSFSRQDMTIRLGKNSFSLKGIYADLGNENDKIKCVIKYDSITAFEKSLYAPSVMGPFSYIPMPCSHAVASLRHNAAGILETAGKTSAVNAFGYIEKDFGKSFPRNYFWMHAADYSTSIMFATAWPLIFGIRGFLCVISHAGKQYNLSLYTGAKLTVHILSREKAAVTIEKGKNKFSFNALSRNGKKLAAPARGGKMSHTVCEDLSADCTLYLSLDGNDINLSKITKCAFECELI